MELIELLSQNLRRIRKEKELSQVELGALAGITGQYVSDIERGTVWPGVEILNKLSVALNITPTELLFDDDLMIYRLKKLLRSNKS